MQSKTKNLTLVRKIFPLVLVFVLAAFIYGQYGLDDELSRTTAANLYAGQKMAEGVPPYVSIFDVLGPLGPMLAGLGVMISEQLGWGDIYTARLLFLIIGCFAVASVYLLGEGLFRSQRVGMFAALTFLGFFWFGKEIARGPYQKVPMVLFVVLSLLLTSRRRWFWAGLCGSLSFLVWQPTAIFPLTTLFVAALQPRQRRLAAVTRVSAGIGLPLATVGAYFYYHGAFYKLLDGAILFHILYGERGQSSLLSHFLTPIQGAFDGFTTMFLPILLGFVMLACLYFSRWVRHGSLRNMLAEDAFAPILLSLPAVVVWSLIDFQNQKDFLVLLPYAALGFGAFLDLAVRRMGDLQVGATPLGGMQSLLTVGLCVSLVALALANTSFGSQANELRQGLNQQKEEIADIEDRFGSDVKLISIDAPEVLVLQHRTNPTPYAFIVMGIDNHIDANVPGGFEGWVRELEAYDPDVIALRRSEDGTSVNLGVAGARKQELMNWLDSNYHLERAGAQGHGGWPLYVRNTIER